MNLLFLWSCGHSKRTVEPLFKQAMLRGYDCRMEPRGAYDTIPQRIAGADWVVHGVGMDAPLWRCCRQAGVKAVNVMHGQYVLDTWYGPAPEYMLLTGEVYREDALKNLRDADPAKISCPGYMAVDRLRRFRPRRPDVDCLVTLPHMGEHPHLFVDDFMAALRSTKKAVLVRPHPRNVKTRKKMEDMGFRIDSEPEFVKSLARARCIISGPSNCIMEACALGVPAGVIGFHPLGQADDTSAGRMRSRYGQKLRGTFSNLATFFEDFGSLKAWLQSPEAKPKENTRMFWANFDQGTEPVQRAFFNLVRAKA